MLVQIPVAICEQCGIVNRRTVGQHDQTFLPFLAPTQTRRGPFDGFAVDILLDEIGP